LGFFTFHSHLTGYVLTVSVLSENFNLILCVCFWWSWTRDAFKISGYFLIWDVFLQFCGAIVFIFLLELAVAVLAFLFQDWVRDRVKEFFENNIKSYRDDIDLQNLIDSLQKIVSAYPVTSSVMCPGRICRFESFPLLQIHHIL